MPEQNRTNRVYWGSNQNLTWRYKKMEIGEKIRTVLQRRFEVEVARHRFNRTKNKQDYKDVLKSMDRLRTIENWVPTKILEQL